MLMMLIMTLYCCCKGAPLGLPCLFPFVLIPLEWQLAKKRDGNDNEYVLVLFIVTADSPYIVSMGTGSKCLGQSKMSPRGMMNEWATFTPNLVDCTLSVFINYHVFLFLVVNACIVCHVLLTTLYRRRPEWQSCRNYCKKRFFKVCVYFLQSTKIESC